MKSITNLSGIQPLITVGETKAGLSRSCLQGVPSWRLRETMQDDLKRSGLIEADACKAGDKYLSVEGGE